MVNMSSLMVPGFPNFFLFIINFVVVISTTFRRNSCDSQIPNRINTTDRLIAIRNLMNSSYSKRLDAVYVTHGDEHQSEFLSSEDERLKYISGFSGSSGEVLITMDKAAFWTDGRYHLQADEELDCNWLLMRSGTAAVPSTTEWLQLEFPKGAKIGMNPKLISANMWNEFELALKKLNANFTLIKTNYDLIDAIWKNKNNATIKNAFTLSERYTGKSWEIKVNEVLKELNVIGADSMIITALDEIAWLLNIRGQDIPYNYLLKAYIILTQKEINLYTDLRKVKGNVIHYFENYPSRKFTVKFKNYESVWKDLKNYSQIVNKMLVPSVCVFEKGASKQIYDAVATEKKIFNPSPIVFLKAQKNPVEINGMETAHIKDGASMCKLLHYFETTFYTGKIWDEWSLAKEIDKFRYQQGAVPSFSTIVAFGIHGALPHYMPTSVSSKIIFNNSTILIDSGGQYLGGTTDISRTIHLGVPTNKQKEIYTRVLIGSIQLSSLTFPQNLEMTKMDVIARTALWEIGCEYTHGTGHGIGAFLNVHESPISIKYDRNESQFLKSGYFTSNEPGCYLKDEFGVRLENVMEVVENSMLKDKNGKSFLSFKDVTLVPYDMKLINFGMLTKKQVLWLNKYNRRIRTFVGAELRKQYALNALHWLMEHTRHISLFP